MTLAYSGEVIPLQTPTNHKPIPESSKNGVLDTLAKDPDTSAFGELLKQVPSFFDALDARKEYYIFVPTTDHVVEYLQRFNARSRRLGKREVQIRPGEVIQAAEKPKGAPDIKHEPRTLKSVLLGPNFANLGTDEGARMVSEPTDNGEVRITSGFGNSTRVHAEDITFEMGVIKKCDGLAHRYNTVIWITKLTFSKGSLFFRMLSKMYLPILWDTYGLQRCKGRIC